MSFAQHEGVLDALVLFTLVVVTINSVFVAMLLYNFRRQREREDAARPPPAAERAKRVEIGSR
jgi:hypothetical protein